MLYGVKQFGERKRAEEAFKQYAVVQVLVATDAAREGINLQ